jgi:ribosomal protein L40E
MLRELLVAILLITVTLPMVQGLPGDTSDNPIAISEGIHNAILPENNSMWYSINLTGNYIFTLDAALDTDFDLYLFDSNLQEIYHSVRSTYPDKITTFSYYGVHLLEVRAWSGSGSFTLNVTSFPVIPGDNERNPIEISEGDTQGIFDGSSEFIWYNHSFSGNYNIKLIGDDLTDFDLYMYDQDLNSIGQAWGPTYPKRIDLYSFYEPVLIKIEASSGVGSFILNVTSFPLVAGDSPNNPIQLSNNMKFSSRFPVISGGDLWAMWFSIEINGYQRFILDASTQTDFDLYLYTLDLIELDSATSYYYPEIITTEELVGTFLLRVFSYTGEGNFDLITQEVGNTPGSSFDMAIPIEIGNTTGMVPGPAFDQSIWYKITVDGNYTLTLYADDDGIDLDMYVYDADYDLFTSALSYDNPENLTLIDVHGEYYIKIKSNYLKLGEFTLSFYEKVEPTSETSSVDDSKEGGASEFFSEYGIPFILTVSVIASYLTIARKRESIRPRNIKQNISKKLKSRKIEGKVCLTCGTFNPMGAVFCEECGSDM